MIEEKKSRDLPPLLGQVAAGFPSPAEQYAEPGLDLNKLLVKRAAATFYLRATGESMVGACILHGDILIVDRSIRPFDGCIVIARVDGEFTVKYYRVTSDGPVLEAANPQFKPIRFAEGMELHIDGVVTAVIHQFIP